MADIGKTALAATSPLAAFGMQWSDAKFQRKVGEYNRDAAYAEAESMDIQAGQEVAAGTHQASRIAKRAAEIMAEQRVNAAAGGGSTSDATVVAVRNETVRNATLDQLLTMAGAEERAQQIEYGADVRRSEGDMEAITGRRNQTAAQIRAGNTLVSTVSSWAGKFGGGGGQAAGA